MKKLYWIMLSCLFLFLALILPETAYANESKFLSNISVHYAVAATGITTVTYDIKLTNTSSVSYPHQYRMIVEGNVGETVAHDGKGVIIPEISVNNGKTDILVTLRDEVAGIGKSTSFTIRYQSSEIVKRVGSIWELHIPGIHHEPDLLEYQVTLDAPFELSELSYISPKPDDGRHWTKKQLTHGGIVAAFGPEEKYLVALTYHIKNSTLKATTLEVPLPPDTAFQKVTIDTIDPLPVNIYRRNDGNWFARYDLAPKETVVVHAKFYVAVTVRKRQNFAPSDEPSNSWLEKDTSWQTDDPRIHETAAQLGTIRTIYSYVVNTLSYDYTRNRRDKIRRGAVETIRNPNSSLAVDFTDLFIALARSAYIPARQIIGVAVSSNSSLQPVSYMSAAFHTWPEYFDRENELWLPVDPTWENTTGGVDYFSHLDFRHIVLTIGGGKNMQNPEFYTGDNPDAHVSFVDRIPQESRGELQAHMIFPRLILAGFANSGKTIFVNSTGVNIDLVTLVVHSVPFPFQLSSTERNITPHSQRSIPFAITISDFFAMGKGTLRATWENKFYETSYWVIPIYPLLVTLIVLFFILKIITKFISNSKLWKKSKKH